MTYLVWIPRYRYKLWNVDNMVTTGVDNSKIHGIEIEFENIETSKSSGDTNGSYLTHPAFTFGNVELNGIWVGKFETGYKGATSTSTSQVATPDSSKVIIKPNSYSWRSMNVSNMYKTAKGMNESGNIYGLTTISDSHMMKNTEWGAVAYLSHSKYGLNYEVRLNNNNTYKTGCGALTENKGAINVCENQYGTVESYPQSTTGNISGVFDMAGGAHEYMMGYTIAGSPAYGQSGFTQAQFEQIDPKYYDTYSASAVSGWSNRILGDATGELGPFTTNTSSWYGDSAAFVYTGRPWFIRGSYYGDSPSIVGSFMFSSYNGVAFAFITFRIVIL